MPHILIVDDNTMLLDTLQMALEGKYVVFTAASGKEALALIEQSRPDLVITDYAMPSMSGLDLIKAIMEMKNKNVGAGPCACPKTHEGGHGGPPLRNNKIKIILYSACLTDEIRQEAEALGVAACPEKPFDLEEIRELINRLL